MGLKDYFAKRFLMDVERVSKMKRVNTLYSNLTNNDESIRIAADKRLRERINFTKTHHKPALGYYSSDEDESVRSAAVKRFRVLSSDSYPEYNILNDLFNVVLDEKKSSLVNLSK